jgi:CheY-like chemotaxis protein
VPSQTTSPSSNGHSRPCPQDRHGSIAESLSPRQWERLRAYTQRFPIIVTDDDVMVRGLLRVILGNLTVIFIRDSAEVLAICRQHPVSLVISDIMKPRMDGLEMLTRLRADPATEHIPLIFLTGSSCTEALAYELGANGHLMKPFHPSALLLEIWRVLRNRLQ